MKNILILVLLACCVYAYEKPRMLFLGSEKISNGDGKLTIEYLHDSETQQEVVCIYGALNAPSCYLTGRKW